MIEVSPRTPRARILKFLWNKCPKSIGEEIPISNVKLRVTSSADQQPRKSEQPGDRGQEVARDCSIARLCPWRQLVSSPWWLLLKLLRVRWRIGTFFHLEKIRLWVRTYAVRILTEKCAPTAAHSLHLSLSTSADSANATHSLLSLIRKQWFFRWNLSCSRKSKFLNWILIFDSRFVIEFFFHQWFEIKDSDIL